MLCKVTYTVENVSCSEVTGHMFMPWVLQIWV